MRNVLNRHGQVVGIDQEGNGVDLIAQGIAMGFYENNESDRLEEPEDLHLQPAAFSLVCKECSADCLANDRAGAIKEGWTEIEFCPMGADRNYDGMCPTCAKAGGH